MSQDKTVEHQKTSENNYKNYHYLALEIIYGKDIDEEDNLMLMKKSAIDDAILDIDEEENLAIVMILTRIQSSYFIR